MSDKSVTNSQKHGGGAIEYGTLRYSLDFEQSSSAIRVDLQSRDA